MPAAVIQRVLQEQREREDHHAESRSASSSREVVSNLERLEDAASALRIPPRPRRRLAIGLQIDLHVLQEISGPPGRPPLFLQGPVSEVTVYSHQVTDNDTGYEVAFSIFDFPAALDLSKVIVHVTVPPSRQWLDADGAPAIAPTFWPEDPARRVHVGTAEDHDLITDEMGFGYLHDGDEPWPNELSFVPF
jgi:hypothetical protein